MVGDIIRSGLLFSADCASGGQKKPAGFEEHGEEWEFGVKATEMASKVVDLLYWRDVGKTGLVFTGLVVGLACLFQLSAISLLSNLGLGIMAFTLPVRLLFKTMDLVRLNDGSHPFQSYLDEDSSLTDETTVRVVEKIVLLIAFLITELKRLFFIDSVLDSLKFIVLLYLLTYVGVKANGLTLLIAAVICVFSLPLAYKLQQERIDRIISAVQTLVTKAKEM
ncbi:Reticulon-2 [Bagarius yarrelli]|uniref:Reticulon n=1 Tax=Bagarius yarrelli TaxID=175774 RepID=A0A556VCE1_BAGYA|nr:Reticulon-2 [Bagarius yarrelli]